MQYETEGHAEFVKTLFPSDFIGVCIDIGAHHPTWISNSWIFEQAGWQTYCIEPNPNCIPELEKLRKIVLQYAVGDRNEDNVPFYIYSVSNDYAGPFHQASETGLFSKENMKDWPTTLINVKLRTFEWLMENEVKEGKVDYLSIDVEGAEMQVLSTLDTSRWKPKVIVIENYYDTPDQHIWFRQHGYDLVKRIHLNNIYVSNNV